MNSNAFRVDEEINTLWNVDAKTVAKLQNQQNKQHSVSFK